MEVLIGVHVMRRPGRQQHKEEIGHGNMADLTDVRRHPASPGKECTRTDSGNGEERTPHKCLSNRKGNDFAQGDRLRRLLDGA
jgi:hypothetical protein